MAGGGDSRATTSSPLARLRGIIIGNEARLSAVLNVRAPRRGFRFRKPTRASLPKSTVPALPRTSVAARGRAHCHQRHRATGHRATIQLRAIADSCLAVPAQRKVSYSGDGARPCGVQPRAAAVPSSTSVATRGRARCDVRFRQMEARTLSLLAPRPLTERRRHCAPARSPCHVGPALGSACSCVQSGWFIVGADEGLAPSSAAEGEAFVVVPGRGGRPCLSDTMSYSAAGPGLGSCLLVRRSPGRMPRRANKARPQAPPPTLHR